MTKIKINIPVNELNRFCMDVLMKAGIPRNESAIISHSIVDANVMGVDSHGVARLPLYLDRCKQGLIEKKTKLTVLKETTTTTLIDANNGWGQYAGKKAMQMAIKKAKQFGSAVVGVCNSNHFGTAAYFTRIASEAGCLGIAMTNTSPVMVAWGSKEPTLGTNPISIAVPANDFPIILDMATSNTARGRINLAAQNGEPIPKGWALTEDGYDTTDPKEALEGYLLPFGPKGSGLSMMIDIITGVMTGALFGVNIPQMYVGKEPQQLGHTFMAVDIESFMDLSLFKERMDERIKQTTTSSPAPKHEGVYMPGELEQMKRTRNIDRGISLTKAIYKQLLELGQEYDVNIKSYLN